MFRTIRRLSVCLVVAAPMLAASTFATVAAAQSLLVGGAVLHPGAFGVAALQALGPRTVSVTFQTEHGSRSAGFTGVPLWAVLGQAQLAPLPGKNAVLRECVLATGSDGYRAAFSLGELDPRFGGADHPVLVAFAQDGKTLDAPRLVVPGDRGGGRYVSHLARLTVIDVAQQESQQ
jgi:DMSO/TMAO reductase YedYZ molybdopterin-dependent catalytic subunit